MKNHKNSGQLRISWLSHLLRSLAFLGCQNCPRRFKLVGQKTAEVIEHLRAFGSGRHLKKEGILLLGVKMMIGQPYPFPNELPDPPEARI